MRFLFLLRPRLLLPLMVSFGILVLGMRIGDVWDLVSSGQLTARPALAESKADSKPDAKHETEASHDSTTTKADSKTDPKTTASDATGETAKADPSGADVMPSRSLVPPVDEDVSPSEMEILKQLSTRRDALDQRGRQLDTREALIKVAEQRVDQKIQEMDKLRLQLQSMVNQVSETQAAQLDNLVKIYETMKPEEAAHIFETLDMPILLSVIQRMKPKSTAPIMAKMAPDKAKDITIALTKQDQLPQVK